MHSRRVFFKMGMEDGLNDLGLIIGFVFIPNPLSSFDGYMNCFLVK